MNSPVLLEWAVPFFHAMLWTALSACVILFNKYILVVFQFPMILTTWHFLLSTLGTQLLVRYHRLGARPQSEPIPSNFYIRFFVPIGFLSSLNLILNNVAFMYLNVAFIQILKAVGPAIILFAGWLVGLYRITPRIFSAVSFICLGVILSCYGEIHFDTRGVLIQFAAILLEATRLILLENSLSHTKIPIDPIVSLYYYAPICAAFCLVFATIFEGSSFHLVNVYEVGPGMLLCNGLLAFIFNLSSVFLISKTSSLTLAICGVPKAMTVIVASVWLWQEILTELQAIGFFLASLGLVGYSTLDVKNKKETPEFLELDDEGREYTV